MKKTIFWSLVFGLSSLVFCASSVSATTYVVTKTTDTADGTCDADCSLREAITAANSSSAANDIITLPAGTYTLSITGTGEEANATGDLDVTDDNNSLTINGAGSAATIINANDIDRVIHNVSTTSTLYLNDLKIYNGTISGGSGGGISNQGILYLNNVNVESNNSAAGGGGVYSDNILNITNSTISNNINTGTGLSGGGGILNISTASLNINNSIIKNNTSVNTNSGGGGLLNYNCPNAIVTNSQISNNSAISGGGILNTGYGLGFTANLIIINDTISGNIADSGNGGGIRNFNGSPGEAVVHLHVYNSTIASNTNYGLLEELSTLTSVKNSIISNNSVQNCVLSGTTNTMGYNIDTGTTCGLTGTGDQQSTNPLLNSLADNGGRTYTMSISASSPAKDVIPWSSCKDNLDAYLTTDQRGFTRPENISCDVGAYELDQTKPVITMITGNDYLECAKDTWTDAGATVADNQDSIFSSLILASASGSVIEEVPGLYQINYNATDHDGNTAIPKTRAITIADTTAPVITLLGDATQIININSVYNDFGATVADSCDTTLTAVTATGSVNTAIPGIYTLSYAATDAAGNPATAKTRTITVVDIDHDQDGVLSLSDCNDDDATVSAIQTYYQDLDLDTLGNLNITTSVCQSTAPTGYTTNTLDVDDTKADTVLQYDTNSDYYLVLNSTGTTLYLVNLATNQTIATKTLSKTKTYSKNSLKLLTYRNKKMAVIVSKSKSKILTSLVYPNIISSKLTKKDSEKLTNKNIKPSKTRKHKNYLQLRNKKSKVLEQYFVTSKYKLILK